MTLIPDWIDAELRNWSAWCWSGAWPHPLPPSHCASIEHRYQAPSDIGAEVDAEEVARRIPIVRERAEIVHRVYLDRLTDRERRVLVLRYVKPCTMGMTLRKLRCSKQEWETALLVVARHVGNAFRERVS